MEEDRDVILQDRPGLPPPDRPKCRVPFPAMEVVGEPVTCERTPNHTSNHKAIVKVWRAGRHHFYRVEWYPVPDHTHSVV